MVVNPKPISPKGAGLAVVSLLKTASTRFSRRMPPLHLNTAPITILTSDSVWNQLTTNCPKMVHAFIYFRIA
jgi:hypothetical protein